MKILPVLVLSAAICGLETAAPSAAAQQAESSNTIRNTVVIVAKESDCPADYAIFHAETGTKLPSDPKICFVKAPRPSPSRQ